MAYVIIQGRGLSGWGAGLGAGTQISVPAALPPPGPAKLPGLVKPIVVPTLLRPIVKLPTSTESKGPSGTTIAVGLGLLALGFVALRKRGA